MDIESLNHLFISRVRATRSKVALYHKEGEAWVPTTFEAFRATVEEIFHGLRSLGVEAGDRVALLSENRPEWAFCDLAILGIGAIHVPLYFTLSDDKVAYVVENAGAEIIICSTAEQREKVEEVLDETGLETVVTFEEDPPEREGLLTLADLRERGAERRASTDETYEASALAVEPGTTASIIFTSGTTGPPKGVVLTHRNFVSNVRGVAEVVPLGEEDRCLSFLPLSHVFERTAGYYAMMHVGAEIAYAEDIKKVVDNLSEVEPTIVLSVPRIFEKIYDRVMASVEDGSALKRSLFSWAVEVGEAVAEHQRNGEELPAGLALKHSFARRVFSRLHALTGGRLRFFVSGGAPLAPRIARFFSAAGLPIYEGYGLTETSPILTCNSPIHARPGTVGRSLPAVRLRIADDGEILARGPNVMEGYHENPEATAEAIDEEGWFHTGDIGQFTEDGYLEITDRKKDIIITAGGKNVAPQPVENLLKTERYVSQIVCVGEQKPFIGALVVPEFEAIEPWATEQGIPWESREELVRSDEVRAFIQSRLDDLQKDKLSRYEQVRRIELLPEELTEESGELTPTLKVKRRIVFDRYAEDIERLYAEAAEEKARRTAARDAEEDGAAATEPSGEDAGPEETADPEEADETDEAEEKEEAGEKEPAEA